MLQVLYSIYMYLVKFAGHNLKELSSVNGIIAALDVHCHEEQAGVNNKR